MRGDIISRYLKVFYIYKIHILFNSVYNIFLNSGLGNAVGFDGLFSLASYLPLECIISMSTGQAFAGILMNLVRYITLLIFFNRKLPNEIGTKEYKFYESLIFFSFSTLVYVACLIRLCFLYQNKYFREQLETTEEFEDHEKLDKNNNNDVFDHEEKTQLKKKPVINYFF